MLIILDITKGFHARLNVVKTNQKGKFLSKIEREFKCKSPTIDYSMSKIEKYFLENFFRGMETIPTIQNTHDFISKTFITKKTSQSGKLLRTIYYVSLTVYKRPHFQQETHLIELK
jgi:hypothetical protein